MQLYDPLVLPHSALVSQLDVPAAHSSMSKNWIAFIQLAWISLQSWRDKIKTNVFASEPIIDLKISNLLILPVQNAEWFI